MSRQEQLAFEIRSPSSFDETEVKLFVRAVNFVAHDRMTNQSKVALEFGVYVLCAESHELN